MTSNIAFCFDPLDFERVQSAIVTAGIGNTCADADVLLPYQSLTADALPDLLAASEITVVFIGKHTFESEICIQMIDASLRRGNAFLAVYLNNAEDVKKTSKELLGKNPFDLFYFEHSNGVTTLNRGAIVLPGKLKRRLSSPKEMKTKIDFVKVYDFIKDNGAENLKRWIEEERQRKADFWAECDKISEADWPQALKVVYMGEVASFFLYYDWQVRSESKE